MQQDLERASAAFLDIYDWPTTAIDGAELDAPYAAPTSGGPPFRYTSSHPHPGVRLPQQRPVRTDPLRVLTARSS
jgi:hypothetical protein